MNDMTSYQSFKNSSILKILRTQKVNTRMSGATLRTFNQLISLIEEIVEMFIDEKKLWDKAHNIS